MRGMHALLSLVCYVPVIFPNQHQGIVTNRMEKPRENDWKLFRQLVSFILGGNINERARAKTLR